MSDKLSDGHAWIEVVAGREGPSLNIGDDNGGYRLSGPKPWGGGRIVHRFMVRLDELVREASALTTLPASTFASGLSDQQILDIAKRVTPAFRESPASCIALVREALKAAPAIPKSEWQPIETVPKDGTEVALLFADEVTVLGKRRPRVRAASWLGDWTIPYHRDNPPIGWMHMPAAPGSAARDGGGS
ncbi:hypothetical protein [Burkholderia gladioli]|uniref:hypothetical protein n=1 Tax=Burkholderia gladioli TaxID=28095 RepID=UPI0016420088|nr:hypothetical protein [Burkholderia gladioli]